MTCSGTAVAWEEFERDGVSGATGDIPLDELATALRAIARAYEERFARKPTAVEILHSLERLLRATPERYVSDPEGIVGATLRIDRTGRSPTCFIDPARYEGVYGEHPTPEYQVVSRDPNGRPTMDVVISIPKLETDHRTLRIEYIIRAGELDDDMAVQLIVHCVLRQLLVDSYADEVDSIELRNSKTGASRTIPYPQEAL